MRGNRRTIACNMCLLNLFSDNDGTRRKCLFNCELDIAWGFIDRFEIHINQGLGAVSRAFRSVNEIDFQTNFFSSPQVLAMTYFEKIIYRKYILLIGVSCFFVIENKFDSSKLFR